MPLEDDGPYDQELFERLRAVRRELAEGRGLPAYIILHDSALRQIARVYPQTTEEFAGIPRVGAKRARDFAGRFLAEVQAHLRSTPRRQ